MLIRVISIALILIGFTGITSFAILDYVVKDPKTLEMPLTDGSVAISNDNSLFFTLPMSGRVQKYASNGEFVSRFPVDFSGGLFCINVVEEHLNVYVARRNAVDKLDLSGNPVLLNVPLEAGEFEAACELSPRILSVDRSIGAVTITPANGQSPITINRQWWHYVGLSQFASFTIFIVGFFLWPGWRQRITQRLRERFAKK